MMIRKGYIPFFSSKNDMINFVRKSQILNNYMKIIIVSNKLKKKRI